MKRVRLVLLVVILVGVATACASGPGGSGGTSGVEGRVTIGPTCPVQQADSPCPDASYAATIRVLDGDRVVATGRSGSDGAFRIEVPPGTYTIEGVAPQGGIAHARPVTGVVVEPSRFTHVDVAFDSGIR